LRKQKQPNQTLMGPRKRFNLKYSEGLRTTTFQVTQRINFLKVYFETEEDKPADISFQQLKKAQEEVNDFKRFLEFNKFKGDWFEYLKREEKEEESESESDDQ
jgi:hypothetical protein